VHENTVEGDVLAGAARRDVGLVDAGSMLDVRVVDEHGSAVPGALVRVLSAGGAQQSSAETDKKGLAQIAAAAGSTLLTTSQGFAISTLEVSRISTQPVLIRLHPEGTIAGVVVDSTGVPAGSGVFVLALPKNALISGGEAALRALRGDPTQHLASTDQKGRFLLDRLDPTIMYSLACGGSGRVQFRTLPDVKPSQGEVEIVAGWGYAEIICLVDDHGEPLSDDLVHSPSRKFEAGCLEPSVLPVHSGSAAALLACPEIEFANKLPACRVYAYVGPVPLTSVGPNFYSSTLAGCDPVEISFLARPIGLALETTKVAYHCAPEEHGSIEISFSRGGGPVLAAPGEEAPSGLLVLEPRNGAAIKCPVREKLFGPQVVEGIPFGQYQARFVAQRSTFTFPPAEKPSVPLRVEKGVAHFDISLDDSGEVDIEVRDESGVIISGQIVIHMGGPPTIYQVHTTIGGVEVVPGTRAVPNATMRTFRAPPYTLSGIAPGRHFLALREPFRADASGVEDSTIMVEVGKRTKVLFTPQPK
jgi:hypothetical protein